jgi:hypothetical protein
LVGEQGFYPSLITPAEFKTATFLVSRFYLEMLVLRLCLDGSLKEAEPQNQHSWLKDRNEATNTISFSESDRRGI